MPFPQSFSEKEYEMKQRIPVILDGDPGHDDAIAWMLAKSSPLLDIRAVTSVCGNQTIEKTTYSVTGTVPVDNFLLSESRRDLCR